ncbi:MAG: anhydro-N-acetylmuramic acid kinase [Verrucomicrobia bacterium]|nr:anhydro-N-acetylmuramic acid kinase [Verrucomicrobiota bacterium]
MTRTKSSVSPARRSSDGKDASPSLVLGIMSGTSVDAVDYALCAIGPDRVDLRKHWQARYTLPLQRRLHAAAAGTATSWEVGALHHELGRFFVRGLGKELEGVALSAVGLHGQTIFHQPDPAAPATLQIGEPAWLAEALRVPVVSNFRAGDLAAGGQGAPLATLFHQVVFGRRGEFVCVNNLGGISNVTALDWREGEEPRVLAFDTGPANVLMDIAARHYSKGRRSFDLNGAWAARGTVNGELVERWLTHKFFHQPPPKSTGREVFGEKFWERALAEATRAHLTPEDLLATLSEFTAASLALNYSLHLGGVPSRVVACGGGAANPDLMRRIRSRLQAWQPTVEVVTSEELGWGKQQIEAAAFALLAYRRLRHLPGNLPATTGATRPVVLGQVTVP